MAQSIGGEGRSSRTGTNVRFEQIKGIEEIGDVRSRWNGRPIVKHGRGYDQDGAVDNDGESQQTDGDVDLRMGQMSSHACNTAGQIDMGVHRRGAGGRQIGILIGQCSVRG